MEIFAVICMNCRNGKKLYLKCGVNDRMEWTFDKSESCWFGYKDQAEKFAKNYFKNFQNWFVEEFNYAI